MVDQLWRYPLASVGGERVATLAVGLHGIVGERQSCWSIWISARSRHRRRRHGGGQPCSLWLGGTEVPWSSVPPSGHSGPKNTRLDDAVTELLGFRRGVRRAGSRAQEAQGSMEIQPRYKAAPLHLVSKMALEALQAAIPSSRVDVRRFRPNIVLATDCDERAWLGRAISIGSVTASITEATKRCGMTMVAQPGLLEDPEILRSIVRSLGRCLASTPASRRLVWFQSRMTSGSPDASRPQSGGLLGAKT